MDWISINTACFILSNNIAKTSVALSRSVREVREARPDLDQVASLVHSLDGVLDLLKDDSADLPPLLARMTPDVLRSCHGIVTQIEGCLATLDYLGASRADKKSRWLASRSHLGNLKQALQGHRAALALAVDLIALTGPGQNAGQAIYELAAVAARISEARASLNLESRRNAALAGLPRYLDALEQHALSSMRDAGQMPLHSRPSVGDAPDSAVELSDDGRSFIAINKTDSPRTATAGVPSRESDAFIDELSEMPQRAPVPPPKSRARAHSHGHRSTASTAGRPADSSFGRYDHRRDRSLSSSLCSSRPPPPGNSRQFPLVPIRIQPPVDAAAIQGPSQRRSVSPASSRCCCATQPEISSLSPARPSTSSQRTQHHDGYSTSASPLKRRNSRLSSALRSLSFHRQKPSPPPRRPPPAEPISTRVFGVPLAESMLVARGLAGTRHDGGGESSHEYPLCVLRCAYFLRDAGVQTPNVFGQDSDADSLAQLRAIFSSPETGYGKVLDWSLFTPHEAADVILCFLAELPQPLVPEPVAKRWVVLSRQANIRGSLATRLDQGLDFWEEALTGLRGPARVLLKLLLNLWADIARAAHANDMTAERLAGRLMRPLLHLPPDRYDTDLLLGLAFLIRKRSDYNLAVQTRRASHAAS